MQHWQKLAFLDFHMSTEQCQEPVGRRDFAEHIRGFNQALSIYQNIKLYVLEKSISNNPK